MSKKRKREHHSKGKSVSVGICTYFAMLFEANELKPKKLTDEQILQKAMAEYPGRPLWEAFAARKYSVNVYRNKFNKGEFTQGLPPESPSFRYSPEGFPVRRNGITLLLPQEIQAEKEKQKKRRKDYIKKSVKAIKEK